MACLTNTTCLASWACHFRSTIYPSFSVSLVLKIQSLRNAIYKERPTWMIWWADTRYNGCRVGIRIKTFVGRAWAEAYFRTYLQNLFPYLQENFKFKPRVITKRVGVTRSDPQPRPICCGALWRLAPIFVIVCCSGAAASPAGAHFGIQMDHASLGTPTYATKDGRAQNSHLSFTNCCGAKSKSIIN